MRLALVNVLYFLPRRSAKAFSKRPTGISGGETGFRAREVVLSQNEVVLLAFGSTSAYELEKFVWWMKREISLG